MHSNRIIYNSESMAALKYHLKFIYYPTRVFGIVHYNLYEKYDRISSRILDCVFSVPYFIYHLILLFLEKKQSSEINRDKLKLLALTMVCFGKITTDYFWFVLKRRQMVQIIHEIEKMCTKLPIDSNHKKIKIQTVTLFIAILILWIVTYAINFTSGYDATVTWITEIIIFIGFTNYFMYVVTNVIRRLFLLINNKAINFALEMPAQSVILAMKKNTEIHLTLANLARKLNSLFAVPLLGNTLILFGLSVIVAYHLTLNLYLSKNVSENVDKIIGDSIFLLFVAFQLVFMVYSWDSIPQTVSIFSLFGL